MVPMFTGAGIINSIHHIHKEDITEICEMADSDINVAEKAILEGYNDIKRVLHKQAMSWDAKEFVVNEFMCSDVCPCLERSFGVLSADGSSYETSTPS